MLQETLTRFILHNYKPRLWQRGPRDKIPWNREIWSRLAELGVVSALFEERDGGLGGLGFDIMAVFETLGSNLVTEPFLDSLLVGRCLSETGSDSRTLSSIMTGESVPSFAHQEPHSRFRLNYVETSASRTKNGWILNGKKSLAGWAGVADIFLVSARTSGNCDDQHGISLFLVKRAVPGVDILPYPNIDGGLSGEITFSNVNVRAEALIGDEGRGFTIIESAVGAGLLALSAEALGTIEVLNRMTLEYLQTRIQFGTPIGKFQALQHRMVNMLIEMEQTRSAVINAAAAFGTERVPRERSLSAAKYTVGRSGTIVAEESIQMHGGIGMTWEMPVSHYAKRLVMIDHQLGDEDYHLNRYIALSRHLESREPAPW
jgi:alkylation response protein AidB-like acyl-CoA dehydrogenase